MTTLLTLDCEDGELAYGRHSIITAIGPYDLTYNAGRLDVYSVVDVGNYIITSEYTGKHRQEIAWGDGPVTYWDDSDQAWIRCDEKGCRPL